MERRIQFSPKHVGRSIREFLSVKGEAGPYDFYKVFREHKPSTSYASIRKYFYILKQLGLIEWIKYAPSRGPLPRSVYRIVAGRENDSRWRSPQSELYEATALGRQGYRKFREEGKVIPSGRRRKYIKV